jgi:hypothetical protein
MIKKGTSLTGSSLSSFFLILNKKYNFKLSLNLKPEQKLFTNRKFFAS